MKQYRQNIERQKWLYSMEKSRKVLRRFKGKPESGTITGPQIKDSSEPWLPGGVRSVADGTTRARRPCPLSKPKAATSAIRLPVTREAISSGVVSCFE